MTIRPFIMALLLSLLGSLCAEAAPPEGKEGCDSCRQNRCRPYGDWCRTGPRGGYGARRPVKSADDARALLREYLADDSLVVAGIVERPMVFIATVTDAGGNVVDRLVIHKRGGRIRSIFP